MRELKTESILEKLFSPLIKNSFLLFVVFSCYLFSFEIPKLYHGIGLEMTQNGAGIHYSPEIDKPNIYSKFGLHFERSNKLELNPSFNTQNPGFKKTIGLFTFGFRKTLLKNYFSNNMSIHFLGEYSIGNSLNDLVKGVLGTNNNRIVTGLSLQIPSGILIKRYDFCFQTSNKISGRFLIRIHFLKKLL